MGKKRGVYRFLMKQPEGKSLGTLGRPRSRGEDNIKMAFRKWVVCVRHDRAISGYGKMEGTCECGNETSGSIKCGEFLDYLKN